MKSSVAFAYPVLAITLSLAAGLGWQRSRVKDPPRAPHAAVLSAVGGHGATAVRAGAAQEAGARAAGVGGAVAPGGGEAARAPRELRLVVADEGNEARYRVREQLARIEFPSDAVGGTSAVTGTLVIADDGSIVRGGSSFVVDLRGLKSDSDRRDGFIQRRTLETEQYPTVEFVPTRITGLATPLRSAGELALSVTGELTVHGTTKPVTWDVEAQVAGGVYTGTATTAFTFDDFGMTKPRVAVVLSVMDTIRLEYDFRLVTAD